MKKNQPTLRLLMFERDEDSVGYRSGRNRWRDTPVSNSIASTRSAGTLARSIQVDTVLCRPTRKSLAKAVCPPTALHASTIASRRSSFDMSRINAQTDNGVNADFGNCVSENAGMTKKAEMPASAFWIRLTDSLPRDWGQVNPNNLATRLHMSQGSIYRWYTGEGLPETKTALQLAKAGGVCLDWLLNNVKPRYPISKDPILRELFEVCEDLDEEARLRILRMARGEALQKQGESDEVSLGVVSGRRGR